MRFLKNKILLAQKALGKKGSIQGDVASDLCQDIKLHEKASSKKISKCTDTKNMSINYGRAIVAFAISPLAKIYLENYFDKENSLSMLEFISLLIQIKYQIKSINSLRSMLLVEEKDSAKEIAFKKVFQWISQIFIKYFSVNWIINGKMTHKLTYLKYRSKMLRRIQNPEHFTYVRDSKNIQKRQK